MLILLALVIAGIVFGACCVCILAIAIVGADSLTMIPMIIWGVIRGSFKGK